MPKIIIFTFLSSKLAILVFLVLTAASFSTLAKSRLVAANMEIGGSNVLILSYGDFGPASMSFELLGPSWWSWESSGSSNASQKYAIKVVIYTNNSLQRIKRQFPINANENLDYRYIRLKDANEYLDKNIEEDVIHSVTNVLYQTKAKLAEQFKE